MDVLLWKCMTDRLLSDVCLQLNLFHHFLPLCQLQQISTRCILSEMSAILNDWSQPYPRKNWSKLSWLLKSYFKTLSETRVNLKYWSKRLLLNRKTHFITTVCPLPPRDFILVIMCFFCLKVIWTLDCITIQFFESHNKPSHSMDFAGGNMNFSWLINKPIDIQNLTLLCQHRSFK